MQLFDLSDKTAIVTGASSGIGAHLVQVLASAGASVHAVARRQDRLESLARTSPGVVPHVADITDEAACVRLVAEIAREAGAVDILINNAGTVHVGPAEHEPTSAFREVLELNLVSAFVLCREVGRTMLGQPSGGSIINVSSIVGLAGLGRMPQAGYAASKAGLTNMTRELAAQWAGRGVRVNAIAPGWFPTEMTAGLFADDKGREWVARLTPMRREGRLDELNGAVLLLASEASTYMTGTVIPIDGGWSAV